MCTVISDRNLFGRTLDLEYSYSENTVCAPRGFHFDFIYEASVKNHPAIIGVAHVHRGVPLFYDAVNERGLAAAALNFPNFAYYNKFSRDKINLASFELIPWLLCNCESVASALERLKAVNITSDSVSPALSSTPLHWMIADKDACIVAESTKNGLMIYKNPFGVMTNAPEFPYHAHRLSEFMNMSPYLPKNHIFPSAELISYSRGTGAVGLPGDLSSASRFIRAAYAKAHTLHSTVKEEEISRFFHIMDTVSVPLGCVISEDKKAVSTVYTSCADLDTATYYFTTYGQRRIRSVSLKSTALDSDALSVYPMECREDILYL